MTKDTDFIDRLLFSKQMTGYLRSAHITVPVDQYMMLTILLTVLSALLMMMVGVLLYVFDISFDLISFLPQWLKMLLAVILIPAGVFVCLYYYPQLEAQGRKTKIDMDLPYAITYMQALSSTITLYDIFRSVYDAADLYGEVSKECGLIVRDVELFGEDLLTAMENAIRVTPSENFRELLNDLMLVYRSGGNLTSFFNAKSES
ncbi:MAG: type II secretion system F family protein [Methanocalculaceae archaeon]|jgi:flagellar protein FlaJ|nr:type II secretion system F family protein [Methanocalculaceae archaeon]